MYLILRCTTRCNLSCVYCFEKATRAVNSKISSSNLERIYRKVNSHISRNNDDVTIEWTGGEPLLLGPTFFEQALALQRKCLSVRNIARLGNCMQTNGVLLDNSYLEVFQKYNMRIGVSFDVSGASRLDGKKPVDEIVRDKIVLLLKSRIPFGVIVVVTKHNVHAMEEIYTLLRNAHIPFHFNFLNKTDTIYDSRFQPEMDVLVENCLKTIKTYYNDLVTGNNNGICVANFDEDINVVRFNDVRTAKQCSYQVDCFRKYLSIEPDGSAYPCPSLKTPESYLGNIYKQSLDSLLNHPFKKILEARRHKIFNEDCSDCKWRYGCNGGCVAEAYYSTGLFNKTSFTCNYRKKILPLIRTQLPLRKSRTCRG
jgi:uncharacterized protein